MDSTEFGERIESVIRAQTDDSLRSIIGYTRDAHTIHYLRSDVRQTYDERNIERAIDELRLETLEKEYINNLFKQMHGDFDCRIDVFENAVEMNFAVAEGEGLEIAIDRDHFVDQNTLVGDIIEAINEYLAGRPD
ncbi:DUF7522 family protein [Haloplanus natans]|uniref:DUF7522 family protein n=1 Tax=Haloplanus natans TaxID=376171 RepID=UPI000677B61B|nr:hypothetical protein [Haloplanus natans]